MNFFPDYGGGDRSDDSEEDEERKREMEAMLYAQIHHEEKIDSNEIVEGFKNPETPKVEKPLKKPPDLHDSGHSSPKVVSVSDSEDSEDSDDGITVLSQPQKVRLKEDEKNSKSNFFDDLTRNNKYLSGTTCDEKEQHVGNKTTWSENVAKRKSSVIDLISLDVSEEEESSEDSSVVEVEVKINEKPKENIVIAEKKKRKAEEDVKSEEKPAKKPKIEIALQPPEKKSPKNVDKKRNKYLADLSAYSPSSSSDSDDGSSSLDGNISINVSAKGRDGERYIEKLLSKRCEIDAIDNHDSSYPNWSDEMKSFYCDIDWDLLALPDIEIVRKRMPQDPELWKVSRRDLLGSNYDERRRSSAGRYFVKRNSNVRCRNCWEFGHFQSDCPEPIRPVVCKMCGVTGHTVDYCPNAKCLQCGSYGASHYGYGCFRCERFLKAPCHNCGAPGHMKNVCPDNWRKYHATTSIGLNLNTPIKAPEDFLTTFKMASELWCCNCGRKGHELHHCRAYRPGYPLPLLQTNSYRDSFMELKDIYEENCDQKPREKSQPLNSPFEKKLSKRRQKKELKKLEKEYKQQKKEDRRKSSGVKSSSARKTSDDELADEILRETLSSRQKFRQKMREKSSEKSPKFGKKNYKFDSPKIDHPSNPGKKSKKESLFPRGETTKNPEPIWIEETPPSRSSNKYRKSLETTSSKKNNKMEKSFGNSSFEETPKSKKKKNKIEKSFGNSSFDETPKLKKKKNKMEKSFGIADETPKSKNKKMEKSFSSVEETPKSKKSDKSGTCLEALTKARNVLRSEFHGPEWKKAMREKIRNLSERRQVHGGQQPIGKKEWRKLEQLFKNTKRKSI